MARKSKYADMFTLRSDGRYVATITVDGKRKYIYDKDPENLFLRVNAAKEPEPPQIHTFREVAGLWEGQHREEIGGRTWINYKPHYDKMLSLFGDMDIEEITAMDIANELAKAKAEKRSATIVRTIRSMYSMIFDFAVVNGYLKYNPVLSVKLPKGLKKGKRSAPTNEQVTVILKSVDKPFGMFPFFLICTGCRKSEALALTWKDIDLKKKKIYITKSIDYVYGSKPQIKPPKTEAGNREIPIPPILLEPLKKYKKESTDEYLFPNPPSNRGGPGGGIMHDRAYDGMWKRYCQETGLEGLTAHQLRHGTATLLFENNVRDVEAQKILGHSRAQTTMEVYTEIRAKRLESASQKLSAGLSKLLSEPKKHDE